MTPNLLEQTDEDQPQVDESKNYLEELVGPGKKFATVEEMAKGKHISDEVIKIKDKRFDALLEDYKKTRDENIAGPKLQDLVDKYDELKQQLTSKQNTPPLNEDKPAAYDPQQVESLIDSRMTLRETTRKETDNYNLIQDKLIENLGNNYKSFVKDQANKLGLTDDEVNSMARRNPNLFIKTFDLNVPKKNDNFQTPPRSNTRSDNFAPKGAEKRDWNYYEGLRKKDPMVYFDKKIAVQMEKDAQVLGEAFYKS